MAGRGGQVGRGADVSRLLYVSLNFYPLDAGSIIRACCLLHRLGAQHQVTLASLVPRTKIG